MCPQGLRSRARNPVCVLVDTGDLHKRELDFPFQRTMAFYSIFLSKWVFPKRSWVTECLQKKIFTRTSTEKFQICSNLFQVGVYPFSPTHMCPNVPGKNYIVSYNKRSGVAGGGVQVRVRALGRRPWRRNSTLFTVILNVFLNRNLDQNMLKNAYFFRKKL